jgi:hypothetical protein
MLATLLALAAAASLPDCSSLGTSPWTLAEEQQDVIAEDPGSVTPERVRARSSHKKWASRLNDILYGDENWLAADTLKPTMCGPVREVQMFGHIASGDESDVHFMVVPAEPTRTLLAGLSPAELKMCKVPGGGNREEPCLFGEGTPNKAYEDQLCTTQCSVNHTNYIGQPWDQIRDVCVRGPMVLEMIHGFRPEVHPSELAWSRFAAGRWFVMVARDASQRFDHPFYFAPWPSGAFGPWSVTANARFDLWFVADAGPDPFFTLRPRVGLTPEKPVRIEIGVPSPALPTGLKAVAEYVCQEGAGRRRGRLRLEIEARQRGEKNRGGRNGQSHAAAVEIFRDAPAPKLGVPSPVGPKPSPPPVVPPPMELVALARKVQRRAEDLPRRVELDALFVTGPDQTEDELYHVESLNRRRHRDDEGRLQHAGQRPFPIDVSFSTEPARPVRTMEPLKLAGGCTAALGKDEAVLVAVSVNGQADVTLTGPNIEKGVPPQDAPPIDVSPDMERQPPRRPGLATVDVCVPRSVKAVSLRSEVRSNLKEARLKSETSLELNAPCPSAREILEREAKALSIPDPTIGKLLASGERLLPLLDGDTASGDEGPLSMLARASYALALSMAADCPQELSAHKPGGKAVLRGLLQKYAAP